MRFISTRSPVSSTTNSSASSSATSSPTLGHTPNQRPLTYSQDTRGKIARSASLRDPVLDRTRGSAPVDPSVAQFDFYSSIFSQSSGSLQGTNNRDIFGNEITVPDKSNPTRFRDERPLDTILSFEYQETGNPYVLQMMETPRLGFGLRSSNPYQDFGTSRPTPLLSPSLGSEESFGEEGVPKKRKRPFYHYRHTWSDNQ